MNKLTLAVVCTVRPPHPTYTSPLCHIYRPGKPAAVKGVKFDPSPSSGCCAHRHGGASTRCAININIHSRVCADAVRLALPLAVLQVLMTAAAVNFTDCGGPDAVIRFSQCTNMPFLDPL